MCLETLYSTIAKYPENVFDALKTGQNKNSDSFQEIGIPQTHVWLSENFQNLIALQVWCLAFTKKFEWLANGTVIGQNSLKSYGYKICKKS